MNLIVEQNVQNSSKTKVGRNSKGLLMNSKDLGLLGGSVQPSASSLVVEVEVFQTFKHIDALARKIYMDYGFMASHRGGKLNFTHQEFIRYVKSLFKHRVDYVRGDASVYGGVMNAVFLPHILASVMGAIGNAYLDEYRLMLVPVLKRVEPVKVADQKLSEEKKTTPEFMNKMEILTFSQHLFLFSRSLSISMAEGLPKEKEGDALVMSFNYTPGSDVMAPDTRRHPSLAISALISEVCLPQAYLTPRVKYIDRETVDYIVDLVSTYENIKDIK